MENPYDNVYRATTMVTQKILYCTVWRSEQARWPARHQRAFPSVAAAGDICAG